MDKAAALFRASNLIILDYSFDASLASALQVCDEAVVVVDKNNQDHTLDLVYTLQRAYGKDLVTVVEREWRFDRMWQERVWNWGMEATDAEWLMYHDADEAMTADAADRLRELMANPEAKLISLPYIHLYGTPNWRVIRDFYPRNTRLGRRSHGYRMRNWCSDEHPKRAVCQVVWGQEERNANALNDAEGIVLANTPMYHYGWTRNGVAMAISQRKHKAWYADGDGLEDGRIPDMPRWKPDWERMIDIEKIAPFEGEHPEVMGDWFEAHGAVWQCRQREAVREWLQEKH
jgi:hypothetical protein